MTLMQVSTQEHVASAYSNAMVGTGYLAYRDLDVLVNKHVNGVDALDFGCGRGRSSRFLSELGFQVDAIDICPYMIKQAAKNSLDVNYLLVGDFHQHQTKHSYDFILAQLLLVEIKTD